MTPDDPLEELRRFNESCRCAWATYEKHPDGAVMGLDLQSVFHAMGTLTRAIIALEERRRSDGK